MVAAVSFCLQGDVTGYPNIGEDFVSFAEEENVDNRKAVADM